MYVPITTYLYFTSLMVDILRAILAAYILGYPNPL